VAISHSGLEIRMRLARVISALIILLMIVACGPKTRWDHTPREEHVVRSGETLYAIAWRYGTDPNELARWNNLSDRSLIYPGQVLRLTRPAGMPAASSNSGSSSSQSSSASSRGLPPIPTDPPPPWRWPTDGAVAVEFGKRPGSGTGILIAGEEGQAVKAAANGRVVYSGGGLTGYGELIILKHNDTYLSAYGHNASLLVSEGDTVKKGQRIARMGEGPGREPRLHFEIRKNGEPVNPRQYLPAR
jgi:lipoprotein NlpD